jgi:hypothetical protein
MINAVAALRAYLLSVPDVVTAITQGSVQNIYGIPSGIPRSVIVNGEMQPAVAIQQIRIVHDPYSPRERYRLRIRTYGKTAVDSSNLMRLVHNKAFITNEGHPVRNVLITNRWFLFSVDPTDEGPIVLNEEIRQDGGTTSFPVTVSSYDCVFDGSRGIG